MKHIFSNCAALSAIIFCHTLSADSAKVCDDLFKLTCAPGSYDDGTGVAQRPSDDQEQPLVAKLSDKARAMFKAELEKPENKYFRKVVLSATGLSAAPQCDSGEDSPSADCLERMSQGATEFEIRFLRASVPNIPMDQLKDGKVKDVYYLLASEPFDRIKSSLLEDTRKSAVSDPMNKKIETVFNKVRDILVLRVGNQVIDPQLRKNLTAKLKAIRFAGQDCSSDGNGGRTIAAVLEANAAYNPLTNSFKYCLGLNNSSTSEFTLAYIISHELSHSVDPCGITMGPSDFAFNYSSKITRAQAENQFPIGKAISCLRSEDSVRAMTAEEALAAAAASPTHNGSYPGYGNYGGVTYPMYYGASAQASPAFTSFCNQDQITESFADWMAMEIMPDYIEQNHPELSVTQLRLGYSNMFRPLCQSSTTSGFNVHPETDLRANAIALVQPKIRKQMECASPPQHIYCPPEGLPVSEGGGMVAPPGVQNPYTQKSGVTK